MKILMLGNWSGMASQIGSGLRNYGHEVTIAAFQDSFKGAYDIDINLSKKISGFHRIDSILNLIKLAFSGAKFDVVHLQTPFILSTGLTPLYLPVLAKLLSLAKIKSLSLAGDDYYYWNTSNQFLAYGPWEDAISEDYGNKLPFCAKPLGKFVNDWVVERMDLLIPSCYEYIFGYKNNPKLTEHIPFAFNVSEVQPSYYDQASKNSISILYAESRPGFKGSKHILPALNAVKEKYGDDVAIRFVKKVPYLEYKNMLASADIIIDQAYSFGWGMNAVEAMALGKVVLSGSEKEALAYQGIDSSPIINILPNAEDIYMKLCNLIDNPEKIVSIGIESRAFAEAFHGYEAVIPKIVKAWSI